MDVGLVGVLWDGALTRLCPFSLGLEPIDLHVSLLNVSLVEFGRSGCSMRLNKYTLLVYVVSLAPRRCGILRTRNGYAGTRLICKHVMSKVDGVRSDNNEQLQGDLRPVDQQKEMRSIIYPYHG